MSSMYYQKIDITDWGPYITHLILCMPRAVKKDELAAGQFCVYVEIKDRKGQLISKFHDFAHPEDVYPCKGYREVTAAYPCDEDGNAVDEGYFVALEMPYGPIYPLSAGLNADFEASVAGHEYYTNHVYTVTQIAPIGTGHDELTGLVFDRCAKVKNPKVDKWVLGVSSYEALPLRYGYYVPQAAGGRHPLIVWLHGAGEGGNYTEISFSGNKVTNLTEDWVQKKFGGAYVFSPQSPTYWMDDGVSKTISNSGQSIYVEALKAAIDEFLEKNEAGIDTDRIYIGGDSNGGFMTMRMLMDYPGFFAAAFPICEAMYDKRVTDADIEVLAEVPIWFTHAKNDPLVPPADYVLPTYKRLVKAGAKNLHFTFWDNVKDLHGLFKDKDGNPYEYFGHATWVHMLNDDCKVDFDGKPVVVDGREVTLLDWLALQKK